MGSIWDRVLSRLARSYLPKALMMTFSLAGLAGLFELDRVRHRFEEERARPYELNGVVLDVLNGKEPGPAEVANIEKEDRSPLEDLRTELIGFKNDLDLRSSIFEATTSYFTLPPYWTHEQEKAPAGTTSSTVSPGKPAPTPARVASPSSSPLSAGTPISALAMIGPSTMNTTSAGKVADPRADPPIPPIPPRFATEEELFTELYQRSDEEEKLTAEAQKILKDTETPLRTLEDTITWWTPALEPANRNGANSTDKSSTVRRASNTTASPTPPDDNNASTAVVRADPKRAAEEEREVARAVTRYTQIQQVRAKKLMDLEKKGKAREQALRRVYWQKGIADLALARRRWRSRGRHEWLDSIVNHDSPLYIVYTFGWYAALSVSVFALTTLLFGLFRAFSIGTTENSPPVAHDAQENRGWDLEDVLRKSIAAVAALAISTVTVGTTVRNAVSSPINALASADVVKLDSMVPVSSGVQVSDRLKRETSPLPPKPADPQPCAACDALKPYTEELNRSITSLNEHLATLPAEVQTRITAGMSESTKSIAGEVQRSSAAVTGLSTAVTASVSASHDVGTKLNTVQNRLGAVSDELLDSSVGLDDVATKLDATNNQLNGLSRGLDGTKDAADKVQKTNQNVDSGIKDQNAIGETPAFWVRLLHQDEYKATDLAARTLFQGTESPQLQAAVDDMRTMEPKGRSAFLQILTEKVEKQLRPGKDPLKEPTQKEAKDTANDLVMKKWRSLILHLCRYPR